MKKVKNIFLPFLYLLICLLGLVRIITVGWDSAWTSIKIPSMNPSFADMRTIQGAIFSHAEGFDPQTNNPGDPWNRSMNYPSIWLNIAQWLHLENEINFYAFCIGVVIVCIMINVYILTKSRSVLLLLSFISSASLLAFERGNNDLIVYTLLIVFAVYMNSIVISGISIFIAIWLKMYPLLGLGIYLLKSEYKQLFKLFIPILPLLIFLFTEYSTINSGNTASGVYSYGISTLTLLRDLITTHITGESSYLFWIMLVASLFIIIFLLFHSPLSNVSLKARNQQIPTFAINLFYIGALIYVGTFIGTANWDYRLIFLSLCIPYLTLPLSGIKGKFFCIIILLSMNTIWIESYFPSLVDVSLFAKTIVFVVLSVTIAIHFYKSMLPILLSLSSPLKSKTLLWFKKALRKHQNNSYTK